MSAPHDYQNNSQQRMASVIRYSGSGVDDNGDQNQPQQNVGGAHGSPELSRVPSIPEMEAHALRQLQAPTPFALACRALALCMAALDAISEHFVGQPLADVARYVVNGTLDFVRWFVRWSNRLAYGNRSVWWYIRAPIALYLTILTIGISLGSRFLDIQLPQNQTIVMFWQNVEAAIIRIQESWSRNPPFPVQQPPDTDIGCSSSVSSTSNYESNLDTEPLTLQRLKEMYLSEIRQVQVTVVTEQQTPPDESTHVSEDLAAQPMDLDKEGTLEIEDNKRSDSAEKVHEAEVEEQLVAITADEAAAIAAALESLMGAEDVTTSEDPRPATQPASSVLRDLLTAGGSSRAVSGYTSADNVTISEGRQPATQPASASSRDLLVAEGSSREGSGSSKLVQKTTFKAKARSKTLKGIKVKLNPAS